MAVRSSAPLALVKVTFWFRKCVLSWFCEAAQKCQVHPLSTCIYYRLVCLEYHVCTVTSSDLHLLHDRVDFTLIEWVLLSVLNNITTVGLEWTLKMLLCVPVNALSSFKNDPRHMSSVNDSYVNYGVRFRSQDTPEIALRLSKVDQQSDPKANAFL